MRYTPNLLLVLVFLVGFPAAVAGQVIELHDLVVGLNHTSANRTNAPGRAGYHIGVNAQFNLKPEDPDSADQKVFFATALRFSRRNFYLSSDKSGEMGASFIDLAIGPKFSGEVLDFTVKGQLAIPISNSADKINTFYTRKDFDGAFATLLGEISLKISERVHIAGEVSLLSSVYYSYTSAGGYGTNGRPYLPLSSGHKLRWVGLSVKHVLGPRPA